MKKLGYGQLYSQELPVDGRWCIMFMNHREAGDGNASAIYNKGDTVVLNGTTYVAGWWTKGQEPGTTGEWGVWKAVK